MIISTTHSIENRPITTYHGLVFSEVVMGSNFMRDIIVRFTDFFGGRSGQIGWKLNQAREIALKDIREKAQKAGGNAIVGVQVLSGGGRMISVSIQGTAVTVDAAK
ncbi:YbjQ family protein [uncultured Litoreibacter sp.]|uniref:YbjQ family protein n=1 Tax=uncultured Litoreibacter sp. TaxID=1392394 RepID=UPI0026128BA7|nr:YbjQ family protein [uncultured Litoreibacter sp.]